jgi:Ion channel
MRALAAAGGLLLIALILWDAFETIILPRRVTRRLRLARLFFRYSWRAWAGAARRLPGGSRKERSSLRDGMLGAYGPLALLLLVALWAMALVLGFALLQWGLGSPMATAEGAAGFGAILYLSGVTFFTLGFGDVVPLAAVGRTVAVLEAATGFGFLALVIGYLPTIYTAFSGREVNITLLDARAGSPPSAAELLRRHGHQHDAAALDQLLRDWERWAAELLESHLSFPVLSFYRSQHDNQSWLAALSAILDTCAILLAGIKDACPYQAQLTFAMARHAAVDLALVFRTPPQNPDEDRLPRERLTRLRAELSEEGLLLRDGEAADRQLDELRGMYEPFLAGLARYFLFALPVVVTEKPPVDNWQTSAWTSRTPGIGRLPGIDPDDEHFD